MRRNRRASLPLVRLSVHQPLALGGDHKGVGSLCIGGIPRVRPEVELAQVAVQMALADAVERAVDAALQ